MLLLGCIRQNCSDVRTCLGEPAGHFSVGQFQRFRARLRIIEFEREARAIVLKHGKLFFEIAAFRVGLYAALARSFELIERSQETFESRLKLNVSAHKLVSLNLHH